MNTYPKPSPFKLGTMAARKGTALRALPYGPGWRQDQYIAGYRRVVEQSQANVQKEAA